MVTPQALLPTRKISEHYIGQVSNPVDRHLDHDAHLALQTKYVDICE
jgi:hypothetical protein